MMFEPALAELAALLPDRLLRSAASRAEHAQSESLVTAEVPLAVAFPLNTAEVAALVRICARHALPITPWGAGTSLEGHALPLGPALTVDFSRMAALISLQPEDGLARVQPGITREALNHALRDSGYFFPVDPGANATLGGMASTRASGTTAVRYGTMRDRVAGLEVVLADGTVMRCGTGAPKSASGYDLTALFVGAEGTLGLMTELTLRLAPQPEAIATATCAFGSLHQAVASVIETMQSGLNMARIEFLDAATVAACNSHSGMALPLLPHLLVEFHGSAAGVAEEVQQFSALAAEHGCHGLQRAERAEERARLWQMRHRAYPAILASRPGARAIVTDCCVPISRLAEAVEETAAEIADSPIRGPILGHVGDGNFHAILLVDPANPAEVAAATRLADGMAARALRLGGTVTGEHGIGFGKLKHMAAEHGAAWPVMGAIKRALDPAGLMNPGKLVAADD